MATDQRQMQNVDGKSDTVYFWKVDEQPYGVFSQWYKAVMVDANSKEYPSAEHYMMHHKALLFKDTATAQEILTLKSVKDVKAAGRKVKGFNGAVWDANKCRIVYEANVLKFSQHPQLKSILLQTGDRPLVEASPFDRVWGVGFNQVDAPLSKEAWGENLLGKALESVRRDLR